MNKKGLCRSSSCLPVGDEKLQIQHRRSAQDFRSGQFCSARALHPASVQYLRREPLGQACRQSCERNY